MHDLEKRFPHLPSKLQIVIKVPGLTPTQGKVIYQSMSVPIEKCLKFIDALDGNKKVQILTSVKKEKPVIAKPITKKSVSKKTETEIKN